LVARRWTRYWNFSIGVVFMASSLRPGLSVSAWLEEPNLLTSLCLHRVVLDGGRSQTVGTQVLADLGRV
jgi:hypothetical protein